MLLVSSWTNERSSALRAAAICWATASQSDGCVGQRDQLLDAAQLALDAGQPVQQVLLLLRA